jgi:hypothetical protein
MTKIPIITIPLLLVVILVTSSCGRPSNPSGDQASNEPSETEKRPEAAEYPRLYQKYFDSGSQMEGVTPFDWPANTRVLQLFEENFLKYLQLGDADKELSFAIQRSESDSLLIQVSPQVANDSKAMIAIWVQREKDDEGNSRTIRRISPPLSGEKEALLLLRNYASADEELKNWLEWKENSD